MEAIFGTDGVRDRAGEGLLSEESVRRLGRAIARAAGERDDFPHDFPGGRRNTVLVARDTRASGEELFAWLAEELARAGLDVCDLGVLPTPGAARCAAEDAGCVLAIVLSASHNPAEYNGIKLLNPFGAKAGDALEERITRYYWDGAAAGWGGAPGRIRKEADRARARYVDWLLRAVWRPERWRGLRVVVDAAHGAAFRVAPEVFRRLGAEVVETGAAPDGGNINLECGALHPQAAAARVVEAGAALGFAFDGDADRVVPLTATGRVLDGDHVLALAGRTYKRLGRLPRNTVVATVMSNLGLEIALRDAGIRLLRTAVGDRHVYLEMVRGGHPVGGEQSGHLIFLDAARTGDGILSALRLVDVLERDPLDLEREASIVRRYPQVLRNVRVKEKAPLEALPGLLDAQRKAEAELRGEGRVLLRYSGTEPLLRIMVEGPREDVVARIADELAACVAGRH